MTTSPHAARPGDPRDMRCLRCEHPADWHRLDDSTNVSPTDPAAEFRCIGYDCEAPGGLHMGTCPCPDFDPPPEYVAHFDELVEDARAIAGHRDAR